MAPTRTNRTRPAARPTSRHFQLSVPFIQAARRVPVRQRPTLLTWLRRLAARQQPTLPTRLRRLLHPHPAHLDRTFHQLDPTTGRWHRL